MNFYVKVGGGVAALIVVAALAVFFLSSSEEKVIQKLLEGGLKAAEEGNSDGVIALLSTNYRNGDQTYEGIAKRIRQAVSQRITPARMEGAAIQVSGDDAEVVLNVADTGVGIPTDEQAQIFERFHRVSDGDQQPGSGIGLALVAEMTAAAVRGDITVARQIHDRYFELFKNLFLETNPIPVKTALKKMGMYNGEMRLPMCEMTAANEEKLEKTLRACKVL